MRKRLMLPIIVPVAVIGIGAFLASNQSFMVFLFDISTPPANIPSADKISDNVILNRTSDVPEVKAFLAKYQKPFVYIDRAEHFGVEYVAKQPNLLNDHQNEGNSAAESAAILRVRLDDNGYPQSTALWCNNPEGSKKIGMGIVGFLENEKCF